MTSDAIAVWLVCLLASFAVAGVGLAIKREMVRARRRYLLRQELRAVCQDWRGL